jgi:hypothetical protein
MQGAGTAKNEDEAKGRGKNRRINEVEEIRGR